MVNEKILIKKLKKLLTYKKSKQYYCKRLGISEGYLDYLISKLREENKNENEELVIVEVNEEQGTQKSVRNFNFEPKSTEELYELHKIDKSKYKIVSYWSKLRGDNKFTSSVFAVRKTQDDYSVDDLIKFLERFEIKDIGKKSLYKPKSEVVDLEISIADFHLSKKSLENETLLDRRNQYESVLTKLGNLVNSVYNIRKAAFPISNDFFHSDTYYNTTTNGTQQEVLVSYNEEYEVGFEILSNSIFYLSTIADEVEVILVQGNHDRAKSYFLAHALSVLFRNNKRIKFKREDSTTKFTVLGNTFIGYHHGYNCKLDDLPLLFATSPETSKLFGESRYREVHTGDKHHYMAKEVKGVRIQQMPSLCGTDRWHRDNNYVNQIRAGLALVYHPDKGKIAEFEERI